MDKEIIIDGVKVEECSYYNKDNTPYCCEVWDNECEAQNCYYKQLKRLEQENERLKEGIKEKESEIRQKKMTILMNNDHYLTVDENNRKYKQTLQEIKAIAKTGMHCEGMGCDFMPKILDLITKTEEE